MFQICTSHCVGVVLNGKTWIRMLTEDLDKNLTLPSGSTVLLLNLYANSAQIKYDCNVPHHPSTPANCHDATPSWLHRC